MRICPIVYRFYVPEVINGFKLPPEPDETLNNSTLLGIDINDNGVRDDIERKIVKEFVNPIKIELMLQDAKIQQKILAASITDATEMEKLNSKVGNCAMYLKRQKVLTSENIESNLDFIENNIYNTKARVRKYLEYNEALSGGIYGGSPSDWNAEACDFDVEQMLKER